MPEEIIHFDLERDVIIGVVGDTHIPDRVNSLHPELLPGLKERKIDFLLHTGDVCKLQVLMELSHVAPVHSVRGNRDFLLPASIKRHKVLLVNGVRVLLTHGHVNHWYYWMDKVEYLAFGYKPERYVRRLQKIDPTAKIVIFGHSHRAENTVTDGVNYFNPGSSCIGDLSSSALSYGIIKISSEGKISTEIIPLEGYRIRTGHWEKYQQKKKSVVNYS